MSLSYSLIQGSKVIFSPTWPSGPSWSSSRKVCVSVCVCVCLSRSHAIFFARVDWCGACLVRGPLRIMPRPRHHHHHPTPGRGGGVEETTITVATTTAGVGGGGIFLGQKEKLNAISPQQKYLCYYPVMSETGFYYRDRDPDI